MIQYEKGKLNSYQFYSASKLDSFFYILEEIKGTPSNKANFKQDWSSEK